MEAHRVRISVLKDHKQRGEKFAVLTAYDATMARLIERAGVDVLLVGDSVGTAVLGYGSTLPVTLEAMIHHTAAVRRGTERALIVADMPFLTYQVTAEDAMRNAGRLIQEGGAAAVKLEGGRVVAGTVRRLVDVGIPVMGHVGLLPQSVNQLSGYRRRGTESREADAIHADALALQDAGAFAVVLESIPANLARTITSSLDIPTIGIGAGQDCDGQVLVSHDVLGLTDQRLPPFAKRYADLAAAVTAAVQTYVKEVHERRFPEVETPAATSTGTRDRAD